MKRFMFVAFLVGLAVGETVSGTDAPEITLQLTMRTQIYPQALAFWDLTNRALDDKGFVAGSKFTAENWAQLLEIGKALEQGGRTLATSHGLRVAPAGTKIQYEGSPGALTAAEVQHYIDASPAIFRKRARALQKMAAGVVAAAANHDASRLTALTDSLDEICDDCHEVFWYPNQPK